MSEQMQEATDEPAPKKDEPTKAQIRYLRLALRATTSHTAIRITARPAGERAMWEALKERGLLRESEQGGWLTPTAEGIELARIAFVRVWYFGDGVVSGLKGTTYCLPAPRALAGADRVAKAITMPADSSTWRHVSSLEVGELAYVESKDRDEQGRALWWLGEFVP